MSRLTEVSLGGRDLGWLATPAGRPDLLAVALGRVRDDLGDVRARVRAHARVLRERHAPERTLAGLVGLLSR